MISQVFIKDLQVGDRFSLVVDDEPVWEVIEKLLEPANAVMVQHIRTGKKEEVFYPSTEGLPHDAPEFLIEASLKCWKYD